VRKKHTVGVAAIVVAAVTTVLILWGIATYAALRFKRYVLDTGEEVIVETNLWNMPLRQTVTAKDGSVKCGPVSRSGKRHGRWVYYDKQYGISQWIWYWQGEEVTENRWRELNGK